MFREFCLHSMFAGIGLGLMAAGFATGRLGFPPLVVAYLGLFFTFLGGVFVHAKKRKAQALKRIQEAGSKRAQ